jgi:hypothetical protein
VVQVLAKAHKPFSAGHINKFCIIQLVEETCPEKSTATENSISASTIKDIGSDIILQLYENASEALDESTEGLIPRNY